MGWLSRAWTALGSAGTEIEEKKVSAPEELKPPTAAQVRRTGYEYGIPLASVTTSVQVAASSERLSILNQLHQLYMSCDWVSSAIDVIARTVTAGGLQVVSDAQVTEGDILEDPPNVVRLKRLARFTNPREDMIQLLRGVLIDLLLFGDAYLEVVTLLDEPVALYSLDATTMTVLSDQHGEVEGYSQDVDGVRSADFKPDQIIHFSLDAPRGGLYGVSPAQKALLPATAWLFTMATLKECFRRGDPPRVHVDLGHYNDTDAQRWREQYTVFNLGPKAVGEPIITTGGGVVQVLDPRKVVDYLDSARQLRDEIICAFGVPPSKLGIIETGNLGGGTGEAQDKTFRVNTVIPIANLVLEKLNFHLLQQGFQIYDYHLTFAEIDFRDSKIVEEIRDIRLRNGSFTLNRYRDEIGEPPVPGGDTAIIVDRTGSLAWDDMEAMSKANVAYRVAPLTQAGVNGYVPGVPDPEEAQPDAAGDLGPDHIPVRRGDPGLPPPPKVDNKPKTKVDPNAVPGGSKDAAQGPGPRENAAQRDSRRLSEAWQKAYRARRAQALRELPKEDEVA